MIKEYICKNAYLKYENKIRNNVKSIEAYLGGGLYILLRSAGHFLYSRLSSILIIYLFCVTLINNWQTHSCLFLDKAYVVLSEWSLLLWFSYFKEQLLRTRKRTAVSGGTKLVWGFANLVDLRNSKEQICEVASYHMSSLEI